MAFGMISCKRYQPINDVESVVQVVGPRTRDQKVLGLKFTVGPSLKVVVKFHMSPHEPPMTQCVTVTAIIQKAQVVRKGRFQ